MSITLLTADLVRLAPDAIVNAANRRLLGGGGVDGAIHRAAGPRLLEACRALPEVAPGVRCRAGEARITPGFELPAAWVIHTVGPVWVGGGRDEPALLAACYRRSLRLAWEHGLRSIAFPAISCGAYGYPPELAAEVACASLRRTLAEMPAHAMDVRVCFRDPSMTALWQRVFSAV
jgi:O-acetyl-ADP-ribose deacetylase (regulator of RNase III)